MLALFSLDGVEIGQGRSAQFELSPRLEGNVLVAVLEGDHGAFGALSGFHPIASLCEATQDLANPPWAFVGQGIALGILDAELFLLGADAEVLRVAFRFGEDSSEIFPRDRRFGLMRGSSGRGVFWFSFHQRRGARLPLLRFPGACRPRNRLPAALGEQLARLGSFRQGGDGRMDDPQPRGERLGVVFRRAGPSAHDPGPCFGEFDDPIHP